MPVVRIMALPQPPTFNLDRLMQQLCTRLADIDRTEPRHWWATWQTIEPGAYVEGSAPAPRTQPPGSHPPLVTIEAFTGRSPDVVEQLLAALAQVLCDGLGMEPGNVFATWTELQPGRVFTGGDIRR